MRRISTDALTSSGAWDYYELPLGINVLVKGERKTVEGNNSLRHWRMALQKDSPKTLDRVDGSQL